MLLRSSISMLNGGVLSEVSFPCAVKFAGTAKIKMVSNRRSRPVLVAVPIEYESPFAGAEVGAIIVPAVEAEAQLHETNPVPTKPCKSGRKRKRIDETLPMHATSFDELCDRLHPPISWNPNVVSIVEVNHHYTIVRTS